MHERKMKKSFQNIFSLSHSLPLRDKPLCGNRYKCKIKYNYYYDYFPST